MRRKNLGNQTVKRTITLGLAAAMTLSQPLGVMATEPSMPTPDAQQGLEEADKKDDIALNKDISDQVDVAEEKTEDALETNHAHQDMNSYWTEVNLNNTDKALNKIENNVSALDELNAGASTKLDDFDDSIESADMYVNVFEGGPLSELRSVLNLHS